MIPADEIFSTSDEGVKIVGELPPMIQRGPGVFLDPIESAIEAIAAGRPVVVIDDEDRENEGDLIFAASKATPEMTAFMIRHTSGYICVAMTGASLDRLGLPPMTAINEDRKGTAYAVSVDARDVE